MKKRSISPQERARRARQSQKDTGVQYGIHKQTGAVIKFTPVKGGYRLDPTFGKL